MYVSMKDVVSLSTVSLFLSAVFAWSEILSIVV